uniref:ORF62 n=1 Tax=Cydia pomonella granulosis virus TaxID=28289 RepID=A0A5B8GPU6_GVCP|nr:ORF62 [Cydia pomonella granulovirus]
MSSLKELHHEIIKTQQDIAVTYRPSGGCGE